MLRTLIDSGIADVLFAWNPLVVFLCGIALDIVLSVLANSLKNKGASKTIKCIMVIISIAAVVLTSLTHYISIKCTRVPDSLDDEVVPYSQASLILRDKYGLRCSEEFDDVAMEKQSEGEDLASHKFYVTSCFPKPGTLVENNTEIVLFVSWKPRTIGDGIEKDNGQELVFSSPDLTDREVEDHLFSDFDPHFCHPLNSNEFSLIVEELVVRILTEADEEWSLGTVPRDDIQVQIDLIDYYSGNTIDSKRTYLGSTIYFENIPDGTYYYVIKCNGYKTGYSGSPFILQFDESKMKANLSWITYIEKAEAKYGQGFKVKMLSTSENIPPYTETIISVIDMNGRAGDSYSAYINENGFLSLWMGINDIDYYYIADFYVEEGYTLTVLDDNNQPIEAHSENGVCTIKY